MGNYCLHFVDEEMGLGKVKMHVYAWPGDEST